MTLHDAPHRPISRAVAFRLLSAVFDIFGFIGFLILCDCAWRISAIFGSLGWITALLGLKYQESPLNRKILWILALCGAAEFACALMQR
jgi:hypothetical protein